MDNVTFISVIDSLTNTAEEHAIIAHADGSFTSMSKATYDAQQTETTDQ
jgi:hypothetical protein